MIPVTQPPPRRWAGAFNWKMVCPPPVTPSNSSSKFEFSESRLPRRLIMPAFRQVFDGRLTADGLRVEIHQVKEPLRHIGPHRAARSSGQSQM